VSFRQPRKAVGAPFFAAHAMMVGNPGERERDSGMIPNAVPGERKQDSGMKVNIDSAMKPNSFRPTPESRSA
jgi:hypothetical protein